MSIVYRAAKGSNLTAGEVDENFLELVNALATQLTAIGTKESIGVAQTLVSQLQGGDTTHTIASLQALAAAGQTSAQVQAIVTSAITAVINNAPGALDTLKELADAMGDDPNFAASMTTLIGTKLTASIFTAYQVANDAAVGAKLPTSTYNAYVATNDANINTINQNSRNRKGSFANKSNVAFGARMPFNQTLSNGTDTTQTSRLRYKAIGNVSDLQVFFENVQRVQDQTASTFNAITIEASIEYPSGTFTRITFNNGNNTCLLGINLTILSDYVPIEVPANAYFWVRTNVLVTAGQIWLKAFAVDSTNTFEGVTTGSNLVMSGTVGTGVAAYCFSPTAVLGVAINTNLPSILRMGDSIAHGFNDILSVNGAVYGFDYKELGLFGRSLKDLYPTVKGDIPSQGLQSWIASLSLFAKYHGQILSSCQFALCNLGINDLPTAGTLTVMQGWYLQVWGSQKARGIKIYQTTITPRTTSTDSWATTANQTVFSWESIRVQVNTWIRDGAPIDLTTYLAVAVGTVASATIVRAGSAKHPLAGYIEIADLAETARNSGIWALASDGTQPTGDGLHPTQKVYIPLAAALSAAVTPLFTL